MSSAAPYGPGFQTGHIGINVTDLERSTRFYRDVFGFDVTAESKAQGREFVFLGQGQRRVLTLWLEIYAPTGAEGHAAPTPGAPSCGFF